MLGARRSDRLEALGARIANVGGPLDDLRVEDWEEMIDVNLKGVLYGIAAALPVFRTECAAVGSLVVSGQFFAQRLGQPLNGELRRVEQAAASVVGQDVDAAEALAYRPYAAVLSLLSFCRPAGRTR